MRSDAESVWWPRIRWRLRGALMWPAFAVLTVVDAILLKTLPISGDAGLDVVPALLLAGFFNLVAVAVAAPVAGILLRRRRTDMPRVVADDRAGTGLLVAVTLVLLVAGLAHRPSLQDAQHDWAAQGVAARAFIAREAPPEFRGQTASLTSLKVEDDLYRSCAPGDDPDRWFCVYVSTKNSPPGITIDDNRESNASFSRAGSF